MIRRFLRALAVEQGWRVDQFDPDRYWVTEHLGFQFGLRGNYYARGARWVLSVNARGEGYAKYARSWRTITGIALEDRRTVLELVGTFARKEVMIAESERQKEEAWQGLMSQRKALRDRLIREFLASQDMIK